MRDNRGITSNQEMNRLPCACWSTARIPPRRWPRTEVNHRPRAIKARLISSTTAHHQRTSPWKYDTGATSCIEKAKPACVKPAFLLTSLVGYENDIIFTPFLLTSLVGYENDIIFTPFLLTSLVSQLVFLTPLNLAAGVN
jgi:hypothetical protein